MCVAGQRIGCGSSFASRAASIRRGGQTRAPPPQSQPTIPPGSRHRRSRSAADSESNLTRRVLLTRRAVEADWQVASLLNSSGHGLEVATSDLADTGAGSGSWLIPPNAELAAALLLEQSSTR